MPKSNLDSIIKKHYNKIHNKYNIHLTKSIINNDKILNALIESANLDFEIESSKDLYIDTKTEINLFKIKYNERVFRTKTSDNIVNKELKKNKKIKTYIVNKQNIDFILYHNIKSNSKE